MQAQRADDERAIAAFLIDLRQRTRPLHTTAERTGIVADLLRGAADRFGYALYLRNLLPCYRALEAALERIAGDSPIRALARREVFRATAIEADLESIGGPGWAAELPVLETGAGYARRIARAADGSAAGLIGHAYVRYLGDLNGGAVVGRVVSRALGLAPAQMAFYDFSGAAAGAAFAEEYREAVCRAAIASGEAAAVIAEAERAFACNIALAADVARAAAGRAPGAGAKGASA